MAKNMTNIALGRVLSIRDFNFSRCLSVAEMLEQRDAHNDTTAKRDALALSMAQAGLMPQEGPYYAADLSEAVAKYAPGKTVAEVVATALKEQAAYWSGFVPTVVKTGLDDKAKDCPAIAVDKTHILAEFLALWFTAKNPQVESDEIDALYREIAGAVGVKFDAEKRFGCTAEYVAVCANRRLMSAPYAGAISRQSGQHPGLKYDALGLIDIDDFVVVNFRENHKVKIGEAALKLKGGEALNTFVAHFKNGATRADFGAATKANPRRLNLITAGGKNDNSAIARAYTFAKCVCAFPELNLFELFARHNDAGQYRALPSNVNSDGALGKLNTLLDEAHVGYLYDSKGSFEFSTTTYDVLMPEMEKFRKENPDAYAACLQEVRYVFGIDKRKADPTKATEKAEAAAKAAAPKPSAVMAAVATAPDFIRVLSEYIAAGKNEKLAQWVLDTLRRHSPEFGALFNKLAGTPPADVPADVPAEVEPEAVEA